MCLSAIRFVFITSGLLLFASSGFAEDREQLDRFVKGWQRWRDRTANAEILLFKTREGVNTENKALNENSEWHLRQKGDLWRADRENLDPSGKRQKISWVLGRSESYVLSSRNDSGSWKVDFLGAARDSNVKDDILGGRALTEMPWSVFGLDLASVTAKSTFKIKRISPAVTTYGESWEIDFSYEPLDPTSTAIRGGNVVVAEGVDFGIVHGDFQTIWGSTRVNNIYAIQASGPILLSGNQTALDSKGSGFNVEYSLKKSELAKELPVELFTLSAFGLGDQKRSAPTMNWLWFLAGVGLVCLAAAVLLRRMTLQR